MTHEPTCGIIEVNGTLTVDDLAEFQKQYLPTEQETDTMNTPEQYHPMKVWTWSKEEQAAYQDKIQPLLDAATEAEELHTLDELEEYAKEYNAMTPDTESQAREIELYATNTADLYPEYQQIERSADALIDAGASEEEAKAHAAEKLEPWLQRAATRYYREVGTHHYKRFSLTAIEQAAQEIAENITDEYEYRKPYR